LEPSGTVGNRKSGKPVANHLWQDNDIQKPITDIGFPKFLNRKSCAEENYQSPFWCVRLQHETGRTTFPLATSNREAPRARDIYLFMLANGWKPTLREFKSGSFATPAQKRPGATIGEFLDELATVADLKPKTFRGCSVAFRTIVSQIFRIDGGKGRPLFRWGSSPAMAGKNPRHQTRRAHPVQGPAMETRISRPGRFRSNQTSNGKNLGKQSDPASQIVICSRYRPASANHWAARPASFCRSIV